MKANISDAELGLLAYLHEHATGYGERHALHELPAILQSLAITEEQFYKDISYLEEHGLAGVQVVNFPTRDDPYLSRIVGVWITGVGEDYMRELEQRPGVTRRVTVAVVKEMGSALRTVAVDVLTQLATRATGH